MCIRNNQRGRGFVELRFDEQIFDDFIDTIGVGTEKVSMVSWFEKPAVLAKRVPMIQMILSSMADDEGDCDGDDYAFLMTRLPKQKSSEYK